MKRNAWVRYAAAFALSALVVACGQEREQRSLAPQTPGNNDQGGIELGWGARAGATEPGFDTGDKLGSIAVDPGGRYVLSRSGTRLVASDLATGETETVAGIQDPHRVAFSPGGRHFYVASVVDGHVYAFDAATRKRLWTGDMLWSFAEMRLFVSPTGRHLAVVADGDRAALFDTATGNLMRRLDPKPSIVDVDFTPDGRQMIVTQHHRGRGALATTAIEFVECATGVTSGTVEVPNCSAPLAVTPDGRRGFLAPSSCITTSSGSLDPVSVIDLKRGRFERNLPGFGPVALSRDGKTAVAFMRTRELDRSLFRPGDPIPKEADGIFHLMLINPSTLRFRTVPLGNRVPRYTLTPDGRFALVDSAFAAVGSERQPIRIVDVRAGKVLDVAGPNVPLSHFAMSPTSRDAFLLHAGGLHRLSLLERRVSVIGLAFRPRALNVTPDGGHVLLAEGDVAVHLFNVSQARIVRTLRAPPPTIDRRASR